MAKIIKFNDEIEPRETKKKKSIRKIIKKDIIFVGIILAAICSAIQIYDWYSAHKKIDVVFQNDIKLSYLAKNDEIFSDIYPLFEDYIDQQKEYKFSEKCATQLMITNHFDTQIVIDKIVLEAKQIDVDYRPVLNFESGRIIEDGVSIIINNTGWGNAENLIIRAKIDNNFSSEGVSEDYFKEEALEILVPIVKVSQYLEIPFLENSDLIKTCEDGTVFIFNFEVECDGNDLPIVYGSAGFFCESGKLETIDFGDLAESAYGIKIDTDYKDFRWEENISELIDIGETMIFPICFFPDRSCTMEFKILFEVINDGKKSFISTPLTKISFSVSSIPGYSDISMESIDEDFIFDLENSIVSYPKNNATIVH